MDTSGFRHSKTFLEMLSFSFSSQNLGIRFWGCGAATSGVVALAHDTLVGGKVSREGYGMLNEVVGIVSSALVSLGRGMAQRARQLALWLFSWCRVP